MKKKNQGVRSKRKLYIVLIAIIILVVASCAFALTKYEDKKENTIAQHTSQYSGEARQESSRESFVYPVATEEDYKNFQEIIAQNQMIQELPENSKIVLSFYKFEDEQRIWEKSYLLSKESVEEGSIEDFDIKLIMHSKYITILNENNLCQIIQLAKQNGDFGTMTGISTTSLLWKYKGILEYKDCLGL